jgi:dTDP-4-amino-4,6-dideoxygalactose transaminase
LGNAADLNGLKEIAEQHNLMILEDCCEALGTRYQGEYVRRKAGKAGKV